MDPDHAPKSPITKQTKPNKPTGTGPVDPRVAATLAGLRRDLVTIAKQNIKTNNADNAQNLSVQALIANKTEELQAKIDDYEGQIHNLKGELRTQKRLIQQMTSETADVREKLGTSSRSTSTSSYSR